MEDCMEALLRNVTTEISTRTNNTDHQVSQIGNGKRPEKKCPLQLTVCQDFHIFHMHCISIFDITVLQVRTKKMSKPLGGQQTIHQDNRPVHVQYKIVYFEYFTT